MIHWRGNKSKMKRIEIAGFRSERTGRGWVVSRWRSSKRRKEEAETKKARLKRPRFREDLRTRNSLSLSRSFLLSIKWRLLRCLFLSVSFLSILRNDLPGVCRKCGGSRDETNEIKRTIRYLFFNLLIPIGTIFRSIYKVNKLSVYTLQYILATI